MENEVINFAIDLKRAEGFLWGIGVYATIHIIIKYAGWSIRRKMQGVKK